MLYSPPNSILIWFYKELCIFKVFNHFNFYRIALNMLQFYKSAISPLLQPSCRFLPTCSAYSMDAYKKFGVAKGTLLTAWRLARCNPWGGSGYDPVKWPPPGFENFIK